MAPFGLLIGAIVLVIGGCVLAWTLVYWRKRRHLRLRGVVVQGQVVDRRKQRGYRGQPEYYLTYRYIYEGQTYSCNQVVWRDHYEQWGPVIPLRCLPEKPEVATVAGDDFQSARWVQTTIVGAIFFAVGVFILLGSLTGAFGPTHP